MDPYGMITPQKKNIKITGTSGFKLCISAQKSGGFPKSLVSVLKLAWRFRAETHLAWCGGGLFATFDTVQARNTSRNTNSKWL